MKNKNKPLANEEELPRACCTFRNNSTIIGVKMMFNSN
jgi:hypothetical protein